MNNNLEKLKASLDIITVAEIYGELQKAGANYRFKDDKSIVLNPEKQIFSNFNGDITGGSVLDLVMYMEKVSLKEAINKLKELTGTEYYKTNTKIIPKQKQQKTINLKKLTLYSKNDLSSGATKKPFEVIFENSPLKNYLGINKAYYKLYERQAYPFSYKEKFEYLHKRIIGWDNFFNCPSIILRDTTGKIVDKVSYRPQKPKDWDDWSKPKYIYKNQNNRGENFLYPFQIEVEKLLEREDYIIIGEGIKNSLNALIYSVPYITLEGASMDVSNKLLQYIKNLIDKKYKILAMFDGDEAGENAFLKIKEALGIELYNFFDFSTGDDFTSYMAEGGGAI